MNPQRDQTLIDELNALAASVVVLKQAEGNRTKGEYLIEEFRKKPWLIKFYHRIATAPPNDNAPLYLARLIPSLPPHLQAVAHGVCNRTLPLGCPPHVVLKAIERCGHNIPGFPTDVEPATDLETIVVRMATPVGDSCAGVLLVNGKPAANMAWRVGDAMHRAVNQLKRLGVLFEGERK